MRSLGLRHIRTGVAPRISVRAAPRVCVVGPSRKIFVAAKRRELDVEGYYFEEVFQSAGERVFKESGFLKKNETSILLASIETPQHAAATLELFAQHIKNRRDTETDKDDWHFRKRYYTQLCLTALEMGVPDITFRLFSDLNRFNVVGSYFARDMIGELARAGAGADILARVADMVRCQRPPGDKGAKAALVAVVDALKPRGGPDVGQAEQALSAFKAHAAAAMPRPMSSLGVAPTPPTVRARDAVPSPVPSPEMVPSDLPTDAPSAVPQEIPQETRAAPRVLPVR